MPEILSIQYIKHLREETQSFLIDEAMNLSTADLEYLKVKQPISLTHLKVLPRLLTMV